MVIGGFLRGAFLATGFYVNPLPSSSGGGFDKGEAQETVTVIESTLNIDSAKMAEALVRMGNRLGLS